MKLNLKALAITLVLAAGFITSSAFAGKNSKNSSASESSAVTKAKAKLKAAQKELKDARAADKAADQKN